LTPNASRYLREDLSLARIHIFVPRPIYRQAAILEPVEEGDLEIFPPDMLEKIKAGLREPEPPMAQGTPMGGPDRPVFSPSLSPLELDAVLEGQASELLAKVRGRMSNSASLMQEWVPVNFRPEGQRGERPLTRDEEYQAWESLRETRVGRSLTTRPGEARGTLTATESHSYTRRPVTKERLALTRLVWDPQPFLVIIRTEELYPWLATARQVLQLQAVKVECNDREILTTPLAFGNLDLECAWIDLRGVVRLGDLGSFPTLESVQTMALPECSLPLPGLQGLRSIQDALEEGGRHGEGDLWWEVVPPPQI
jgi:hypothetical protein